MSEDGKTKTPGSQPVRTVTDDLDIAIAISHPPWGLYMVWELLAYLSLIRCGMGGLSRAVLFNRYGNKATLIGWAIAVFILTASGPLFVTSRIFDNPAPNNRPRWSDFDFLRERVFWVLLTATIVQGLVNYMPSLCLPSLITLARAIGQPL
ncbi:MAG: hypothetical protein Q9184_004494 [Pyrenodesmia sp. 2 TL-2023]